MPEGASLGLFVAASLVLLLTPGPAVLYIVARSVDQGRRARLVSVLGVHVGRLLEARVARAREARLEPSLSRAFLDGLVVNIFNPKTGLFFLAFLPQFVDVSRGAVGEQIPLLGATFVALGLVTDGLYALSASTAARWLRGYPGFVSGERWVSGGMYIWLGVAAALTSGWEKVVPPEQPGGACASAGPVHGEARGYPRVDSTGCARSNAPSK